METLQYCTCQIAVLAIRNAQRVPLACFHRKGVLDDTDYDPYNGKEGQAWGYGAYAVTYVLHQPQGMQVKNLPDSTCNIHACQSILAKMLYWLLLVPDS